MIETALFTFTIVWILAGELWWRFCGRPFCREVMDPLVDYNVFLAALVCLLVVLATGPVRWLWYVWLLLRMFYRDMLGDLREYQQELDEYCLPDAQKVKNRRRI